MKNMHSCASEQSDQVFQCSSLKDFLTIAPDNAFFSHQNGTDMLPISAQKHMLWVPTMDVFNEVTRKILSCYSVLSRAMTVEFVGEK